MQKTFYRYKYIWCFILFTFVGERVSAQSQNPFDIQSRKYIDSSALSPESMSESNQVILKRDSLEDNVNGQDYAEKKDSFNPTSILDSSSISSYKKGSDSSDQLKSPDSLTSVGLDKKPPDILPDKEVTIEKDISIVGQDRTSISWWYYLYDLVLLLILLGAFLYDKKIFPPLRKAFLHENFLRFLYRDTYLRKPGVFIYLNIIFLLALGFILFRTAQYYNLASTFFNYLIIQGVVIVLFLIKHIALHVLSRLVDKPFEVKFYQYWMILSAGLIGLWMIPLALMISVLPFEFLYIALIITSIPIILILTYRQVKAIIQAKFFLYKHFFQYFLYFCAVEIVPAVLLADILVHY